jgi:hypothetical protein
VFGTSGVATLAAVIVLGRGQSSPLSDVAEGDTTARRLGKPGPRPNASEVNGVARSSRFVYCVASVSRNYENSGGGPLRPRVEAAARHAENAAHRAIGGRPRPSPR